MSSGIINGVSDESRFCLQDKEDFAEDVLKGTKTNFAWNLRQYLPEELRYGVQFDMEAGLQPQLMYHIFSN